MAGERYWEFYDDQTSEEFSEVSYVDLIGNVVTVPTESDLAAQVFEIRRRFGADTEIKVYARQQNHNLVTA